MKAIDGLLDANGKPGEIEVLLKGGEKELREFTKDGVSTDGRTSKCFVLTAPGDIISVDIKAGAHTADIFDLEVDGILRASIASKTSAKIFHGTINKVCFKGTKRNGKRDGAKYCGMKVQRRDTSMDATFSRDESHSAVSSLVIKAWCKNPTAEAQTSTTSRVNMYEEYASWKELKTCIGKEGPQPPFEIDFIDPTKLSKKQKDKMVEIQKRKPEDYTPFATLIFSLQSGDNLKTLGFEDVPAYTSIPPPAKPPRAKKELKVKKSQIDDDEEEPEEDGASIVEGGKPKKGSVIQSDDESEEEGRWVLKSKLKPQPKSKLQAKLSETMPKEAPLPTFAPQPKDIVAILNSLLPPKPKNAPSKKEVGKSLNFSRAKMFSKEPAAPIAQALLSQQDAAEPAPTTGSPSNSVTDPGEIESLHEANVTAIDPLPRPQENGHRVEQNAGDNTYEQKSTVLHGEIGGPAQRAFLARAAAQHTESQPQVDHIEMNTETENSFMAINYEMPGFAERINARVTPPSYENPEFEPLTPPVSAKKPLPERDNDHLELVLAQSLNQTKTLSSTFSQATTASTQDVSSLLEVPTVSKEPPVNFDKMIKDLEAMSRDSGFARTSSPALSEATDIADPMEIMESVRNSQRSQHVSFNHKDETSGYHTIASPILGSLGSPLSEKRKANFITGRDESDYETPRKTIVAPSIVKASLEEKMMAAKAKLTAANERHRQLEEERQAALVIKKKNDEVEALLRKAEEVEQNNIELEAEINALREVTGMNS